jgi:hypothetical protein
MRCEYDHGKMVNLDEQICDTPQQAIAETFSSPDWYLKQITRDNYQSCFHFRLKDAKLTIYVWEKEGVCPECGSEDPFEPNKEHCQTCREEVYETVREVEIRAGWDPNP